MSGDGHDNRDTGAPNLASNKPLAVAPMVIPALAVAPAVRPTRRTIRVSHARYTEAFMVSILNRPTLAGADPIALRFIVNSELNQSGALRQLPAGELLLPGESVLWPVPGWVDNIIVDAAGFSLVDLATPEDVTADVRVYQLDRATRYDWKGRA